MWQVADNGESGTGDTFWIDLSNCTAPELANRRHENRK